jgi:hypothetical protein
MATSLARIAPKRQQSPWRKRRDYQKDNPADNGPEARPTAESEARSLLTYMRRTGATVEQMVSLICVSDGEFRALTEWANRNLGDACRIDETLRYRDEVLKHFKSLVEEGEAHVQAGHR